MATADNRVVNGVNKVAGYNVIAKPSDFLKGQDSEGYHKVSIGNRNDWMARGSGNRIVGPWTAADEDELRQKIEAHKLSDKHGGPIEGSFSAQVARSPAYVAPPTAAASDAAVVSQTPQQAKLGIGDPAVALMQALRGELTAAGVRVDEKWGMNRLQTEVELLHKREDDAREIEKSAAAQLPRAAGGQATGVTPPSKK